MNEPPDQERPNLYEPAFREPVKGLRTSGHIFVPFSRMVQMNRTLWAIRDAVRNQPEYVAGYRALCQDIVYKLVHDTISRDNKGNKTLGMIRELRRSTHPYDHLLGAHALGLRDYFYIQSNIKLSGRPEPDPQLEESEWRLLFEAESDPEIRGRIFAQLDVTHKELNRFSTGRPHLRPLVQRLGEVVTDFEEYRAFDYEAVIWDRLEET